MGEVTGPRGLLLTKVEAVIGSVGPPPLLRAVAGHGAEAAARRPPPPPRRQQPPQPRQRTHDGCDRLPPLPAAAGPAPRRAAPASWRPGPCPGCPHRSLPPGTARHGTEDGAAATGPALLLPHRRGRRAAVRTAPLPPEGRRGSQPREAQDGGLPQGAGGRWGKVCPRFAVGSVRWLIAPSLGRRGQKGGNRRSGAMAGLSAPAEAR